MAASPEAEKAAYDQGFQSLKDLKYADAAEQFSAFVVQYPNSDYADNAQYWLGESYYVTRNYDIALEAFQALLSNYPDSPKVPDGLLKIGYTHYELKQWDQARAALVQVQEQYPDTTLARLAGSRLRSMKLEGHLLVVTISRSLEVGCQKTCKQRHRASFGVPACEGVTLPVHPTLCSLTVKYPYVCDRNINQTRVPESREGLLKITEIFYSLQGEARDAGRPTVFIRLTGCPLRCVYCDSEYAFYGGEWKQIDQIMEQVATYRTPYVCVTGGEPLAQKRCQELLNRLCEAGYQVSLETSGAMDISQVDERVSRVLDIKTPDSGEAERNLWANLDVLTAHDQIKFVLCSREDYEWAVQRYVRVAWKRKLDILFSPAWGQVNPTELAEWVLRTS